MISRARSIKLKLSGKRCLSSNRSKLNSETPCVNGKYGGAHANVCWWLELSVWEILGDDDDAGGGGVAVRTISVIEVD